MADHLPIIVVSSHRIVLECSGAIDAHLGRVVIAGLNALGTPVPASAAISVDDGTVYVTWHEESNNG